MLATEMQRPEDDAVTKVPAPEPAETDAEKRRKRDLAERAREHDAAHRKQVGCREMQADAEHQKNDADLGELPCHCGIRHETRRERADEDARDDEPDQRRQAQAICQIAEDRRQHETDGYRRDNVHIMRQGQTSKSPLPFCRRKCA